MSETTQEQEHCPHDDLTTASNLSYPAAECLACGLTFAVPPEVES